MKRGQDGPLQISDARLDVEVCPSPNFGDRKNGKQIDMLLLHYTGMANSEGALSWLCDPRSQVSAHYFVFEDGRIVQMVAEAHRAWHAGKSYWQGERDINSHSIGIEIANAGYLDCKKSDQLPEFPPFQMAAVEALCVDIVARNSIPKSRVLGHSDVAPGRKLDPGEKFDWLRLARAGVGLWSYVETDDGPGLKLGDASGEVAHLQAKLNAFGYDVCDTGIFDDTTKIAIRAFQQHWRQSRADGIADAQTINRLSDLFNTLKNS